MENWPSGVYPKREALLPMPRICLSSKHEVMLCVRIFWHNSQKWDVFVRLKLRAGLMVDFASPKPLVHSVQNIYIYTHNRTDIHIQLYTKRQTGPHTWYTYMCSHFFTKSKQPYRFIADTCER